VAVVLWAVLLGLDQWTKHWVEIYLQPRGSIEVIPGFFDLTYVRNTGIAFGMFGGNNRFFALMALGLLIMGLIIAAKLDWRRWETNLGAALLLTGTLGNLTDRFSRGYVTDFLDFNLGFYRWPAFNLADSCITICVTWILLRTFWPAPRRRTEDGGQKTED
jgi:signal peptidase II